MGTFPLGLGASSCRFKNGAVPASRHVVIPCKHSQPRPARVLHLLPILVCQKKGTSKLPPVAAAKTFLPAAKVCVSYVPTNERSIGSKKQQVVFFVRTKSDGEKVGDWAGVPEMCSGGEILDPVTPLYVNLIWAGGI